MVQFLGLHVHSDGSDHSHSEEVPDYICKILVMMAGIYCFYLMETIFSIITTHKDSHHHSLHHHEVSSVSSGLCSVGHDVAKCVATGNKNQGSYWTRSGGTFPFHTVSKPYLLTEHLRSVSLQVRWIHGEKKFHTRTPPIHLFNKVQCFGQIN